MTRMISVNGELRAMTPEEEADLDAAIAASPVVTKVRQVSMRQARLALLQRGYLTAVSAAINALTGIEGQAAQIEWGYGSTVERDSGLVSAMGQILSLDAVALDELFEFASTL